MHSVKLAGNGGKIVNKLIETFNRRKFVSLLKFGIDYWQKQSRDQNKFKTAIFFLP
jgi:hypothetical protein